MMPTAAWRWRLLQRTAGMRSTPSAPTSGHAAVVALTLATGGPRWEVAVGEARGATELERVTDVGHPGAVRPRCLRGGLPGPRGLLRRHQRHPALDQGIVVRRRRRWTTFVLRRGRAGQRERLQPRGGRQRLEERQARLPPRLDAGPSAARSRWATTKVTCTSCRARTAPSWRAPPPTAASHRTPVVSGNT